MKLQNLTVIFIIIIIPVILLMSVYISTGLKTIKYQALYDTGLLTATHDVIYAFELNTANNELSDNPEIKRDILKSSIKMFKQSLCASCGFSSYNVNTVEEYIPAIVFGMYDGFYMYAPSGIYNSVARKVTDYKHGLKNYVYYSEILNDGTVIRYSLDNYVTVSGTFDSNYEIISGYLIVEEDWKIDEDDIEAKQYLEEATSFTAWFNEKIGSKFEYLYIDSENNPEDENSAFVQHKRNVIRSKMEGVLNSTITAYSNRILGKTYKMPKLSEEDWEKIYTDISMVAFFQGKNIGLTNYNGYCVLNSTNHTEYVNPNLMYFIDNEGYYHDIRCTECQSAGTLTGYKIGSFRKRKVNREVEKKDEDGNILKDEKGNTITEKISEYVYDHNELACYDCVNGQINNSNIKDSEGNLKTIYQFVNESDNNIKKSYWTSLARERYRKVNYK